MRSSSRRTFAVLLGCAGILLVVLRLRGTPTPAMRAAPNPARSTESANEVQEIAAPDAPNSRHAVDESSPTAAIPTTPSARTTGSFIGTIVEEDGSPLPPQTAAWIDFRDLAGARKLGTPEDDRIVLRDLPLGTYAATVYAYARRMAAERIELTASQPDVEKEFRLHRLPSLVVSVVTPDGRPFRAARIEAKAPDFLHEIVPVATREPPGPRFDAMRGDGTDPVGVGEFWDSEPSKEYRAPTVMGTLMLHAELPVYVNLILGQAVLQSKRVEARGTRRDGGDVRAFARGSGRGPALDPSTRPR